MREVDGVHLVTNSRFAPDFAAWAAASQDVIVHDDGTTSNDDRLGAVGDIDLVIEHAGLAGEELLVLAGDNLFEFSLPGFASSGAASRSRRAQSPLYDVGDLELATQYGIARPTPTTAIVEVRREARATRRRRSPRPRFTSYHPSTCALIDDVSRGGDAPDEPAASWLAPARAPVYGYRS